MLAIRSTKKDISAEQNNSLLLNLLKIIWDSYLQFTVHSAICLTWLDPGAQSACVCIYICFYIYTHMEVRWKPESDVQNAEPWVQHMKTFTRNVQNENAHICSQSLNTAGKKFPVLKDVVAHLKDHCWHLQHIWDGPTTQIVRKSWGTKDSFIL